MADRQWFSEGTQVYETGTEEYFFEGAQLIEDQVVPPPAHLNFHTQKYSNSLIGR